MFENPDFASWRIATGMRHKICFFMITYNFHNLVNGLSFFQLRDLVDIFIVSLIIYFIIAFLRQSKSYFILYAVLFLVGVNYFARVLNLGLTRLIFQPLLTFILLFFVIVFQREIRRFFEWFSAHGRRLIRERRTAISSGSAKIIADSVFEMATKKIGAIIVFSGNYHLDQVIEGGFLLDGRISHPLILSIFDPSSPGHDGAVVIENNRIKRFGAHLPLAEKFNKLSHIGTRHRATIGITERTDALAIVVSEEKGEVSLSENGSLIKITDQFVLEKKIAGFLKENFDLGDARSWKSWFLINWHNKLLSVFLATVLWFVFIYQIGVTSQIFTVPVEFKYLPKELIIDGISPNKVDLTLSGNYHDLRNLEVTRDLKVTIDAKNVVAGKQKIIIDDSNIEYPPFLSLVEKNTKMIVISVSQASSSGETLIPLSR